MFTVFSGLRSFVFCDRNVKLVAVPVIVVALNLLPLAGDFVSPVRYAAFGLDIDIRRSTSGQQAR